MGVIGAPSADDIRQRESVNPTKKTTTDSTEPKQFLDAFEVHKRKDGKVDFFPIVSINALLQVANDPSQATYHDLVVRAFYTIAQEHQKQTMDMLEYIVSAFILSLIHI